MFGDIEVHYASTMVSQHNQHKQNSKRRRGHNEKVDRDKFQEVIIQEYSPSL
jgi:hypothetical protein